VCVERDISEDYLVSNYRYVLMTAVLKIYQQREGASNMQPTKKVGRPNECGLTSQNFDIVRIALINP
jgi:hypothetical protein